MESVIAATQRSDEIRCGSCAASTPLVDASDPRCAYCGSTISVPAEVKARADDVERAVADARSTIIGTASQLMPERPGFLAFVTLFQTLFVGVALTMWHRLVAAQEAPLSAEQVAGILVALFGPALLWHVAREQSVNRALARAAKLSFAKLELERGATGMKLSLRCASCGAQIQSATLIGLTIRCKHCQTAMLAPSELVDLSQRRFYERVLALRGGLQQHIDRRGAITWIAGSIYILGALWLLRDLADADSAQLAYRPDLLGMIALSSCTTFGYWALSFTGNFAVMVWSGLPFLLGPSGAVLLYILDALSK